LLNSKGFMAVDLLIAASIALVGVLFLSSFVMTAHRLRIENEEYKHQVIEINNYLEEIYDKPDWQELHKDKHGDVQYRFEYNETKYNTEQLIVNFNCNRESHEIILERVGHFES